MTAVASRELTVSRGTLSFAIKWHPIVCSSQRFLFFVLLKCLECQMGNLRLYTTMPKSRAVLFALLTIETIVLLVLVVDRRRATRNIAEKCQRVLHVGPTRYPFRASDGRKLQEMQPTSATSGVRKEISDPLIFIGGVPSSGTTLMRVLLDAHPDIRCGEETRVIPRLLFMIDGIRSSDLEVKRLKEAGISDHLLITAARSMMETIISGHGHPSKYLCNKDPLALKSMDTLEKMFSTAKFILMVRDGRATTNSIMTRGVTISGVDIKDMHNVMKFWQESLTKMLNKCDERTDKCLVVYYEKLILNPTEELRRILSFLDIPWHDNVLKHHTVLGNSSVEISISKCVCVCVCVHMCTCVCV